MRAALFDYQLPEEAIAQHPLPRGESRLFVLDRSGSERHASIRDFASLLEPRDLLVLNDTKVLPARLFAHLPTGGRVELLLLEAIEDNLWRALGRPLRKLRPGTTLDVETAQGAPPVSLVVSERDDTSILVQYDPPDAGETDALRTMRALLERYGHTPLPPYIKRPDNTEDRQDYQTVYARHPGSVAAPTAGLHFDEALLAELDGNGIERVAVTLHVGIGTFRPVQVDDTEDHRMHFERYSINEDAVRAIEDTKAQGGRIVAVGTTVVRTLEAAARKARSLDHTKLLLAGAGETDLFLTPGEQFQVVDALLTNFHLPRSSLLMLVAAFGGRERVLSAYEEAVREGYRFFSYGDAMFLERRMRDAINAAP